jgi:Tfp pilus assembly protein PilX
MSSDRGSITLWVLGLVLLVLGLGAVTVDLWRVLGERSALVALADSAAIAAASALDEQALRSGEGIVVDVAVARARAAAVLAVDPPDAVRIDVDGDEVTVVVEREVPLTMLGLVVPDDRPVVVGATAVAVPEFRP